MNTEAILTLIISLTILSTSIITFIQESNIKIFQKNKKASKKDKSPTASKKE